MYAVQDLYTTIRMMAFQFLPEGTIHVQQFLARPETLKSLRIDRSSGLLISGKQKAPTQG
jgi:hypothetical protein